MLWVILLLGASGLIGGYAAERAIVPELQYHPGTPNEVVEICRQAAIAAARTHASEMGAQVIRVDAASAGPMRQTRSGQRAPVEVGRICRKPFGNPFSLCLRQAPEVHNVQRPSFRSFGDPALRPMVSRL